MFTFVDKFNSSKDDCLYHLANALNACSIALGCVAVLLTWIFATLLAYVHHVW